MIRQHPRKKAPLKINGVHIVETTADLPRTGGVFILDDPANWQRPVDTTTKILKLTPSKR